MAEEKMGSEPEFAAFVGIDWADRKHVRCLQAAGAMQRETGELEHNVEAVEIWVAELCRRFGQRPIAVAVEQVREHWFFCSTSMSACISSRCLRR